MVRVWLHADRAYAGAPITNTVSLDATSLASVFMVLCNDTISRILVVDEVRAGTQFVHVFGFVFVFGQACVSQFGKWSGQRPSWFGAGHDR